MNTASMPRTVRWLALWFPQLAIDRLRRTGRAPPEPRPFALYEKTGGAFRLTAASPRARAAGVRPGAPLADARAILPDLVAILAEPQADADLLDRIAAWCERVTPVVVIDAPDGLLLEIAGSAHLFDGEAALMETMRTRLLAQGFAVETALAPTPSAAAALARWAPGAVADEETLPALLAPLPVEALRLAPPPLALLRRLGLTRLGALLDAPRQPLAARAGEDAVRRLDALLGRRGEALSPRRPPPPVYAAGRFLEPITTLDQVLMAAEALLAPLCVQLDQRGAGVRLLRLRLFEVDHRTRTAEIRLGRPEASPGVLLRLLRERLGAAAEGFDAAFGFEAARLEAVEIAPVVLHAADLAPGNGRDPVAEARLVDALAARFGRDCAHRPAIIDAHLPDAPGAALSLAPPPPGDGVMRRPLALFVPPQPVEAMAGVPDGPPARFRWRRVLHEIVRAEGPERLAPDWLAERPGAARDYYRIEDRQGRRYWLFREGLYGGDAPPRWFIQGVFG
jgi:protein ImuB